MIQLLGKAYVNMLGGETAGESLHVDYLSDEMRLLLVPSAHTPNLDVDETLADIQGDEVSGAGYTPGGVALDNKALFYTAANSWPKFWQPHAQYRVGEVVRPTTGNGHVYRVVALSGDERSHASTEPIWPTVGGLTVTDDAVVWGEVGRGLTVLRADPVVFDAGPALHDVRYGYLYKVGDGNPLFALIDLGHTLRVKGGPLSVTIGPYGLPSVDADAALAPGAAWSIGVGLEGSLAELIQAPLRVGVGHAVAVGMVGDVDESAPGATVLGASDFTYLGYYDVRTNGLDSPGQRGLAVRYVGGDLRLLFMQTSPSGTFGRLDEISLAGKSYGQQITTRTRSWPNIFGATLSSSNRYSLWWEESRQRLWTTYAVDYITTYAQTKIHTRTLLDALTITNLHGPIGLQGVGERKCFGGVQPLPAWFQAAYGTGPYMAGFGGYASAKTNDVSMGLVAHAFPDPDPYTNNTEIPSASVKVLADHSNAVAKGDWYVSPGAPTAKDRGQRLDQGFVNHYDAGIVASSQPAHPPIPPASWQAHAAPDGKGRWIDGDSYFAAACVIDTPLKRGLVTVASLCTGICAYFNSTLNQQAMTFELQVFDMADLGACALGSLNRWNVQPVAFSPLTLAGLGAGGQGSTLPNKRVSAIAFDPITKILFVVGNAANGSYNRLYAFGVDC